MPYNSLIDRTKAAELIPEQVSQQILQEVPTSSIFLRLANRMPNMTAKQLKMPVMSGTVSAAFVAGDTGLKQTSDMSWDNVYITAEELAVTVPVSEAVIDDAAYDIWGEVRPRIVEAFALAIDKAAFHGYNKPDSWPEGIVPAALAFGNGIEISDDLYADINGEDGIVAMLEERNIPVTSYIGALALRAKLRSAVDENRQPIFRSAYSNGAAGSFVYELNGLGIEFPENGAIDATQALLIAGNFRYARYAIRQDITFKYSDSAVLQDTDGSIKLNLFQQDSIALRAVMRLGWALPKTLNPVSGRNYYPFSVLKPGA